MRNILFTFLATLILLLAVSAWAAGTMALSGTVQSFSPDKVEVYDGHKVYTIDRKKILERGQLVKLTQGATISIHIPFDAVLDIKDKAKK